MNDTEDKALSPYINLRWPEAKWDVSGAFVNDRELIAFFDICTGYLGFRPFSVVHGAPLFAWNSGRVSKEFWRTPDEIGGLALAYVNRRIGVDLTFTNTELTEKNLKDPVGNALLTFFESNNSCGKHAAIVVAEDLYQYIRRHYPRLKLVSSILKVSVENGKGNPDYYRKLAEKYDKVMIHPDDVFNWDLLEKLDDRDRYEFIINEYCIRNCPLRPEHYRMMSLMSFDYFGFDGDSFARKLEKNGCRSLATLLTSRKHGTSALSVKEISRIYEMGFRNFKMQGRGAGDAGLILFDLLRLVLNEDEEDENAMHRIKALVLEQLAPLQDNRHPFFT